MSLELNGLKTITVYAAGASAPTAFDISQTNNKPPHPRWCPSVLILLTFLPLSCPLPHLCSLLPSPHAFVFTLWKHGSLSRYQCSTCTLYSYLKPERPPPPTLWERRGTELWTGGSPSTLKILFHTVMPQCG